MTTALTAVVVEDVVKTEALGVHLDLMAALGLIAVVEALLLLLTLVVALVTTALVMPGALLLILLELQAPTDHPLDLLISIFRMSEARV